MPTLLGNILRAGERRPFSRYGLDPVACWPAFWLVLPQETRSELTISQTAIRHHAHTIIWGALSLVWAHYTAWAALPAAVAMVVGHARMVDAAERFALLMTAAFDVHRVRLYKALRFSLPAKPADEGAGGEQIMRFLREGIDDSHVLFTPVDTAED